MVGGSMYEYRVSGPILRCARFAVHPLKVILIKLPTSMQKRATTYFDLEVHQTHAVPMRGR